MHSRKSLALSLILTTATVALSSAAVVAAKPPPKNSTTVDLLSPPMTPPCPGLAEVTGIYGDGVYPDPSDTYQNVTWATRVNLHFQPKCSDNRDIIALLPSDATGQLTPGDWTTCSGFSLNTPLLRIPALLDAQTGVVGQDVGESSVKYAFHIDSDGDGWFETPAHIFWHEGIHLTRSELTNPNRTVYALTTELTSHYAEVRSAGASLGDFCIPLRLTVTRLR